MIQISHISKSFDRQAVLNDISLRIPRGQIVCLLGPSGSGKTTLIRIILGAIPADSGEVRIADTIVPNRPLLSRIGFMPQQDALYENLSAIDNLAFFAGLYGIDRKTFRQRADEALQLVGLEADRDKLVAKFSGGMKKRLSLGVATLHNPDVLLLDEPTVGIDPVLRRSIWQQFAQWRAEGKTLLVSTHVMDEVNECDQAALINHGRLIAYDTIDNLLQSTQSGHIEELFIRASTYESLTLTHTQATQERPAHAGADARGALPHHEPYLPAVRRFGLPPRGGDLRYAFVVHGATDYLCRGKDTARHCPREHMARKRFRRCHRLG